jgi:hypothetical protein
MILIPNRIQLSKPVMEFYEDGDWLRIETQGKPDRYIRKESARKLLALFGSKSVKEKSDLLIV